MAETKIICGDMNISFVVSETRKLPGVFIPQLCHGDHIVEVMTGHENLENCDAFLTQNKDLKLGVTTADCAPICFSDGTSFGIAHVGWRGLVLGLIPKMRKHFRDETLQVFLGPHLHSFEIQKDFCYDMIAEKFDAKFFDERNGKITFRFSDAVLSCLPEGTMSDPRETGPESGLPSHRYNKTNQRLITVVQCHL